MRLNLQDFDSDAKERIIMFASFDRIHMTADPMFRNGVLLLEAARSRDI